MRTASIETNYSQNQYPENQPSQPLTLKLACLSFFPMMYMVGKMIITFLG